MHVRHGLLLARSETVTECIEVKASIGLAPIGQGQGPKRGFSGSDFDGFPDFRAGQRWHLDPELSGLRAHQQGTPCATKHRTQHLAAPLDLVMLDRSVNPIEEGFDLAIGALPTSYPGVIDEPLCPYPRVVCASPAYLERRDIPQHPRDLVRHDCLTFATTGLNWTFDETPNREKCSSAGLVSYRGSRACSKEACKATKVAPLAAMVFTIIRRIIEGVNIGVMLHDVA